MTAPDPRIRLVVLYGGQSAEHLVSRVTARHVIAVADPARYEICPVGISTTGEWSINTDVVAALAGAPDDLPDALEIAGPATDPLAVLRPSAGEQVVVMPLLHGPMGEDGTVQGMLELAGIPYVGCGVLASAVAMDKAMAKQVAAAAGLPQARWLVLHERELASPTPTVDRLVAALGLPLFVKPANMGSSIGVGKAHDATGLAAALAEAAAYDEWLVVEEAVQGREIEVGVLGNLEPAASLPGEIIPGAEFYDYEDKYVDGTAQTRIPADLDDERTAEVRGLAVDTFRALRCEGMARVDFFYEEGGRGFLLNEVNTIPGFTPISMYPKMWAATGLGYRELIDELVRLALERHERRARKRHTG